MGIIGYVKCSNDSRFHKGFIMKRNDTGLRETIKDKDKVENF